MYNYFKKSNVYVVVIILFCVFFKIYNSQKEVQFELFHNINENNINIVKKCPTILSKKYKPTLWLPYPFLQMTWDTFFEKMTDKSMTYTRKTIVLKNNIEYNIDIPELKTSNKNINIIPNKIVILIPGIISESSNLYIMKTCYYILKTNKYKVIVLNNRWSCETLSLKENKPANLAKDIKYFVDWISDEYKNYNIYFVSFSYGANTLINYLGKYCNNDKIKASVSISAPFCIKSTSKYIKSTIYEKIMLKKIKKKMKKHENELMNITTKHKMNYDKIIKTKSMRDIGKEFISKFLGYSSLNKYDKKESCKNVIDNIKHHLLCINSEDDPIINSKKIPIQKMINNPNIIMILTKKGAHTSYFDGFIPKRWFINVILEYFELF